MSFFPSGGVPYIHCKVYNSVSPISIPNNTVTVINFDSTLIDTLGNMHDNVTNNQRITCQHDGVYLIRSGIRFLTNGTGIRENEIMLFDGSFLSINTLLANPVTALTTVTNFAIKKLNTGDYIFLQAYQNSGGVLNIEMGSLGYETQLEMILLNNG